MTLNPTNAGLFVDLASVSIDAGIDMIELEGYREAGKGAGRYFRWTDDLPALPAVGTGENAWWATDADGGTWYPDETQLNLYHFGAYWDVETATNPWTGTDDYPAFLAFKSYCIWVRKSDGFAADYLCLPKLSLPFGAGYTSATWEFNFGTPHLVGVGSGGRNGGYPTILVAAPGVDGIATETTNTTGNTTRTPGVGATDALFEHIQLRTFGDGGGTTADGWRIRCQTRLIECSARDFIRYGVNITGTIGGGGSAEGNDNLCEIIGGTYSYNGAAGIFLDGGDSNQSTITGPVDVSSNGGWGVWDSSFLGNLWSGTHTNGNGVATSGPLYATNVNGNCCNYSGNRYSVQPGQAAGASTNAPSGTTAANTWWHWIQAGGVHVEYPTWVSGMTWTEGGPFFTDNLNSTSVFLHCYSEELGGPSRFSNQTLIIGGLHAAGVIGGTFIRADLGSLKNTGGGFWSIQDDGTGNNVSSMIGGAALSRDFRTFSYGTLQPWTEHYNTSTGNIHFLYSHFDGWCAYTITGPSTTYQFGRGAGVPHRLQVPEIFVGSTSNARSISSASAMPSSGTYGEGDFVHNTLPSVSSGKVLTGWIRLTSGSGNVLNTDWAACYATTS
ncbi:MAG TPA: hypothetical protein VGF77_05620 [Allosphingosinicella sp.]|jgi:hypothetical protein